MKILSPAAETFITFPHTSPRKTQSIIPKKIARTKIIRAAPAYICGGHLISIPPLTSRRGYPLPPPESQVPHGEAVGSGGVRDPPSGGEEWSVPFLPFHRIGAFGAAAGAALAKTFFNFFFFMLYFLFFISFHFSQSPSFSP